jgi:hypothetical protein
MLPCPVSFVKEETLTILVKISLSANTISKVLVEKRLPIFQSASHELDNPKKAFMLLLTKAKVQRGIEAM